MKLGHVRADLFSTTRTRSLSPRQASHVRQCSACRDEQAAWSAIADAARVAMPATRLPTAVWQAVESRLGHAQLCLDTAPASRRNRHALVVLVSQLRVLRRGLWASTVLMFVLGAGLCLTRYSQPGTMLALVAPLVAAWGVGSLCGTYPDPAWEVTVAAPTSPRLVLLARLSLVAGFDLFLGLAVSAALVGFGDAGGLWTLVSAWLGPMALLSALSLLVAVWRSPSWGACCALTLWGLRVLSAQTGEAAVLTARQSAVVGDLWHTSLPVLAAAGVMLVVSVLAVPSRTRPA